MKYFRYFFVLVTGFFIFGLVGCAVDPEKDILAPKNEDSSTGHPIHAWLWAFDDDAGSVQVYHTVDKKAWASFPALMHPMMRTLEGGLINANLNHSIWMAKGNQIFSFTDGILDHGDHGHIVIPAVHQVLTAPGNASLVHKSRSTNGQLLAFADDARQEIVTIDNQKGTMHQIQQGSAHSAALLAGDYLITTAATSTDEKWARIIYTATGQVVGTLEIGQGAHGDAYYPAGNTAFIACSDGIYVIDVPGKSLKKKIAYTQPGRTNFFYHAPESNLAVGLHKTESGVSDRFLILDLANESLDYITIPNSRLTWNMSAGQFALAREGEIVVFSDLEAAKIYHVNLTTRSVVDLDAPGVACPIAVNYNGQQVWALSGRTICRIYVPENKIEDIITVQDGSDWILVTSYKSGAELFDNENHKF